VHAAEDDREKLVVSARIAEESRVDGHRAAPSAAARLAERMLHVEVTVAGEGDVTASGARRVVASVSPAHEDQHPCARILGDVTRQIEDGVEAGVAALRRR